MNTTTSHWSDVACDEKNSYLCQKVAGKLQRHTCVGFTVIADRLIVGSTSRPGIGECMTLKRVVWSDDCSFARLHVHAWLGLV